MHACTQPATAPLRRCGGARASHRRAPLRINAVSNVSRPHPSGFNQKNKHGFTNVLIVPKKLEHEADRLVRSHERWVNQTHVVGPDGDEDDFGHPRLLEYYVTKGPEVVDALDPRSDGKSTGNVVYTFNMKFVSRFGVDQHFRMSSEGWQDHALLMDMMREHGRFFDRGGRIVANHVDDAPACTARKGDKATNVILRVPAIDEQTADALVRDHQALMRRTHHFTTQLDYDELRPRITQYQVSKHLVREDPWDTKSQLTGDVHYCIHTAFVDALGIRGHRNIANTNPEVYARMTPFFLKHGIHADVTDHVVVANMQRPNFVSNIIRGVGKLFTKTEQDVALQEFEAKLNRPRL